MHASKPLLWGSLGLIVAATIILLWRTHSDRYGDIQTEVACQAYRDSTGQKCGIWKDGACWKASLNSDKTICTKSSDQIGVAATVAGGVGALGLVLYLITSLMHHQKK